MSYRSESNDFDISGASVSSLILAAPSGLSTNDIVIFVIATDGISISLPTGSTLLSAYGAPAKTGYKVITGSPPADFTFPCNLDTNAYAIMAIAFSNSYDSFVDNFDLDTTMPGITPNQIAVATFVEINSLNAKSLTTPSGFNAILGNSVNNTAYITAAAAYKVTGSAVSGNWGSDVDFENTMKHTISLAAFGGGGGTQPHPGTMLTM